MEQREVTAGEIYAWQGIETDWSHSFSVRAGVMRPVLLVDTGRFWHDVSLGLFEASAGRRTPRSARAWGDWGFLALQTAWSWPLKGAPDDLDRRRVEQHVAFLREQAVPLRQLARRGRVADPQLPAAAEGIMPEWTVVRPHELAAPWGLSVELWGDLALQPTVWEQLHPGEGR